ncbi:sterol desaturase family protein [Mycobacterium simiae]|uniref:Sterol desaturase family protein n=1 Tax=Mycobacterium simiae TaxID=1784 RepID=A0A5B1BSJ1_MYCSI|nr:sterol desaturase family protein [Mycobacterium simiae]KAA1250049.1 sterol desaturase family protein [Mycobacterium simiae]
MNQVSPLQPIWDAMLRLLGCGVFRIPLYFLPAVVAVVLLTGIGFSIVDVAIYQKISAKAAAGLAWHHVHLHNSGPGRPKCQALRPTVRVFIAQLVCFMVIGEFLTYWWHRLEHGSRLVFQKVHYLHHRVQSPLTIWTNFVVHPIEGLMMMLCLYLLPLLIGAHPLVVIAHAVTNTTAMVITHSGYDMKLYPRWLLPAASGHELHHSERGITSPTAGSDRQPWELAGAEVNVQGRAANAD